MTAKDNKEAIGNAILIAKDFVDNKKVGGYG